MKKCKRCSIEKDLSEFYAHKNMADGHLNVCIQCKLEERRTYELKLRQNPEWVEKEKIRARERYQRLNYKDKYKPSTEKKREIINKYKKRYPEKQFAKQAASKLPRKDGHELHHWSYNIEHIKDVIELNYKTHAIVHRYMKYDQSHMMYRTLTGDLLDSKHKHLSYIDWILSQP